MSYFSGKKPHDSESESNALSFAIRRMLQGNNHIELVSVQDLDADAKTVNVLPLVSDVRSDGSKINNIPVNGIPFWRLQMGSSAIIINPKVGDIGLMLVCDSDITNVKSSKVESLPGSGRMFNLKDGIYLGGVALLNGEPSEYIEFTGSGINIVAPNGVNIDGAVTTTGTITASGEVTGNGIKLSSHVHGGVESGGSNTAKPQ